MNNRGYREHDGVLGEFEALLRERIAHESDAILNGRCADFADYKGRTSTLKAYNTALEDLKKAVKTYLHEDDDDE